MNQAQMNQAHLIHQAKVITQGHKLQETNFVDFS